jgi:hypothetical protein
MVTLRQDGRGNYTARKRLPDDVREEYRRATEGVGPSTMNLMLDLAWCEAASRPVATWVHVRFGALCRLKSDIATRPRSATSGHAPFRPVAPLM